jgi:hypothetical protein
VHQHFYLPHFGGLLLSLSAVAILFWSCEDKDSRVIDSQGPAPFILSATLSPSAVNSDTINVGPERRPTDLLSYDIVVSAVISHPSGQSQITETSVTFFRSKREPEILRGQLRDDGLFPDSSPQDSVFTGLLQFRATRSEVGSFFIEVTAVDTKGNISNSLRSTFAIERLNQPPTLSNLMAPDTVSRSTQESFVITVMVADPDGPTDILAVTRTTPANNVYFLNDSGVNKDAVAGDGIFTEEVSLSPDIPTGPYVFSFKALDRSNALSNIIIKTVYVSE